MLINVADVLAGLVGAAVILIGANLFRAPQAAAGFGIPAGDALIVVRSGGPKATAYGVHGATAVVMLAICVLLLVG